jgi:arylsulfatase A-like enzyme
MNKTTKRLSRRELLHGVAGISLGPAIATAKTRAAEPPNVIFVTADQMRAQALGCMGNTQVRTPNLDRLASEGVMFTNAVANSPICTPARAIWFTGRYPTATGVISNDIRLPAREVTVAEVLSDNGYKTGLIGKWHLDGPARKDFTPPGPRRQGFDYWAAANICHNYFDAFYYRDDSKPVRVEGYQPDHETDLAIQFLETHRKDKFFLNLHWGPPHDPYVAPDKWLQMYDAQKILLRENVTHCIPKDLHHPAREQIARYYAGISSVDWNMGRLLQALDDLGLAENTAVVFTSDHGDMLLSLGLFFKQWPYEESIRVPLIVRYPSRVKGERKDDCLISHVDLMPTILSLCGAQIPGGVQGLDCSKTILGENGPSPDEALIMIVQPCARYNERAGMQAWRGLRTRRYTYARLQYEDWCLYDNEQDPYQRRNWFADRYDKPEVKTLRDRLNQVLVSRLDQVGDRFDTPAFPKIRWR